MLILLSEELDTSVSVLLGENVQENSLDDIKTISEKLEVINGERKFMEMTYETN